GSQFDQGVIVEEFDGVIHGTLAAAAGLVNAQLKVEIDWALAGKVGHARRCADAVGAVTAGARRVRKTLAFCNVLGVGIKRTEIRAVAKGNGGGLTLRASGMVQPEHDANRASRGDQGRKGEARTQARDRRPDARDKSFLSLFKWLTHHHPR